MRRILVFLICIMFFQAFVGYSQREKSKKGEAVSEVSIARVRTDLEKENIKGAVKSVRTSAYMVKEVDGAHVKGSILKRSLPDENNFEAVFDEAGNIVKKTYFDYSGGVHSVKQYKYNERGQLVLYEVKKGDGNTQSQETYKYNEVGQLVEFMSIDIYGEVGTHIIYEYDKRGQKTQEKYYLNRTPYLRREFKYNVKGELVSVKNLDVLDNVEDENTYTYNSDGLIVEASVFGRKGVLAHQTLFFYDDNQRLTEERVMMAKNFKDQKGEVNMRHTLDYNENGDIYSEYIFYGDKVFSFTYKEFTYDAVGNWVSLVHYENNKAIYIVERNIEYKN